MIKNKTLTLTDENGKVFNTTMNDFISMVGISDLEEGGSLDVYDSEKQLTDFPGLTIVDSEGKPFDIAAMNDAENGQKIIGLDVLIETTHSGENANSVCYHSDSMEKDVETMVAPYVKPLIKNHDTYSEPIGRVSNAYFGPSEFVDRDAINVLFRVTDEDAMPKFLDGRYRTVSIGASAGKVSCNICGKDILKDGVMKFCGHWKGETYAGKKAIWSCRDLSYSEISIVNNPADKWAQVKRITVVKASEQKPETEKKVGDSEMNEENTIAVQDDVNVLIDDILEDDKKTEDLEPEVVTDENQEDAGAEKPLETPVVEDNEDKTPAEPEKTIEDYQKMVDELNAKVEKLEAEKTVLEDSAKAMDAEKIELSDKLVTAEAESKVARDQSLRLAVKYKALLVDSVKTVNSLVENKDGLTDEEIESKSIKELGALSDELKSKVPDVHKTPAPATNPGVVDNKESNVITDDEETKTAKASIVDVNVLMSDMIDSATR